MPPLTLPCLALVTDRTLCPVAELPERVARAVAGGVNMVQLREKGMEAGALLALARRLREVTDGRALLLVNDRVDVAMACGADGVQLGEEGLPVAAARAILGPARLIGRSIHSVDGAVRAEADGADLLLAGTVFQSRTHPDEPPQGVGLLAEVRRRVRIPVLAIGGVTEENVAETARAGAEGAAVIGAILAANDPERAARGLAAALGRESQQQAGAARGI
jgi:thiamine-phosphate pyrophosphorylase